MIGSIILVAGVAGRKSGRSCRQAPGRPYGAEPAPESGGTGRFGPRPASGTRHAILPRVRPSPSPPRLLSLAALAALSLLALLVLGLALPPARSADAAEPAPAATAATAPTPATAATAASAASAVAATAPDDPVQWPEAQRAFFQDGPQLLLSDGQRTSLSRMDGSARQRWIDDFLAHPPNGVAAPVLREAIARRQRLAQKFPSPLDVRAQLLFLNGAPSARTILDCGTTFRPLEVWTWRNGSTPEARGGSI